MKGRKLGRKAKLSENDYEKIFVEVQKKTPYKDIAFMYGITLGHVTWVKQRMTQNAARK